MHASSRIQKYSSRMNWKLSNTEWASFTFLDFSISGLLRCWRKLRTLYHTAPWKGKTSLPIFGNPELLKTLLWHIEVHGSWEAVNLHPNHIKLCAQTIVSPRVIYLLVSISSLVFYALLPILSHCTPFYTLVPPCPIFCIAHALLIYKALALFSVIHEYSQAVLS